MSFITWLEKLFTPEFRIDEQAYMAGWDAGWDEVKKRGKEAEPVALDNVTSRSWALGYNEAIKHLLHVRKEV
jgi:hypothetical protein